MRFFASIFAGLGLLLVVGVGFLIIGLTESVDSTELRRDPLIEADMSESRLTVTSPEPVFDYAADPNDYEQFQFSYGGSERTWLGWGVENVSEMESLVGSKFPVIVLLHGPDGSAASMIDKWDAVSAGYILVAPLSNAEGEWTDEADGERFMNALLYDVEDNVRIDRDQIFLFGYSNGATHAQQLANTTRGIWRAVATHGAAIGMEEVKPALAAVPQRIYIGGDDEHSTVSEVRATSRALANAGHPTDFIMIPGNTHRYYGIATVLNSEILNWFRSLT